MQFNPIPLSRWRSRVTNAAVGSLVTAAGTMRPEAALKPPGERDLVEDLAMRRPWNMCVKAARRLALLRLGGLRTGVTVVIVNWNTAPIISDVVSAVRRFSESNTRILVVDNGSSDNSIQVLRALRSVNVLRLPSNAGHGAALDLAMCMVRTDIAVTLDSDAIPLRSGWLEPAIQPIRTQGAVLSGTRSSRNFVHPVFSAIDVREFLTRGLSFQIFLKPGVTGPTAEWGVNAWDTAELLTKALPANQVAFLASEPPAHVRSSSLPGGFVGDLVYHHGGMTLNSSGNGLSPAAVASWRTALKALGVLNVMQWHESD